MSKLSNLEEMAFDEIRTSVMDTIVSNRLKKNTKRAIGYWILMRKLWKILYMDTLK